MKLSRFVATGLAVVLASVLCAGPAVAAAQPAPSGKINLNTASAEQLTALPGVGPKLAARIVEHRQKEGGFRSVSELMNVKDIAHFSRATYRQFRIGLGIGNTRDSPFGPTKSPLAKLA